MSRSRPPTNVYPDGETETLSQLQQLSLPAHFDYDTGNYIQRGHMGRALMETQSDQTGDYNLQAQVVPDPQVNYQSYYGDQSKHQPSDKMDRANQSTLWPTAIKFLIPLGVLVVGFCYLRYRVNITTSIPTPSVL